ncbi:alkaline phosphatase [bacterium]|nr:alkaline phosphatase [bacterium]
MNSLKQSGAAFFQIILILFTYLFIPASTNAAPKNIVIFISDGCGFFHVDATSMYQYGETGRQVYEQFPVKLAMSTYSEDGHGYDAEKAASDFDYVKKKATDSAASATAISTGVKVKDHVVAVDEDGKPLEHISQRAEELGKSTGVVTSVQLSHATPACFVAHNKSRKKYEEISREMILHSGLEVIMGCGHPFFDNNGVSLSEKSPDDSTETDFSFVGGEETWDKLIEGTAGGDADGDGDPDYWKLIQSGDEFRSLMTGDTPDRLIGIPQVFHTLQQARTDEREKEEYQDGSPFTVPFIETVPTLAEMTAVAVNVLDNNKNGFFLMVEGGAVDWAGHNNQSDRLIEEQIDFNRSVEVMVDWVYGHSDWDETLIIVTADHETGYLTGENSDPELQPLTNHGQGELPGMEWHSDNHTNSLVPFYARGDGSELFMGRAVNTDAIRSIYIDNSDIAGVIFELWSGKSGEATILEKQ